MRIGGVLLGLVLIMGLGACQTRTNLGKIEKPVMVQILTDIHIADAIIQDSPARMQKDTLYTYYYTRIFAQYGVTQEEFDHTMELIRRDPREMSALYTEVLDEMSRRDALTKN